LRQQDDQLELRIWYVPGNKGREIPRFRNRFPRRTGLAHRMLRAVIARMHGAGATALHLLVRPQNRAARALYARAGFEPVPRLILTKLLPRARQSAR